jgi:uncharacterized protein (DUF1330 family)
MTAYCRFDDVEVTDPAAMAEYASKVREMVRRHGGRYLALGGTVETIEGSPTLHEPVLIEFSDLAAAHAWYDSPEYRPLRDPAPGRRPDDRGLLRDARVRPRPDPGLTPRSALVGSMPEP